MPRSLPRTHGRVGERRRSRGGGYRQQAAAPSVVNADDCCAPAASAPAPEPDVVEVEDSLGRVTAEPIFARHSVPHYHGAAMDGIALCAEHSFGASEAAPVELRLRGTRRFAYI